MERILCSSASISNFLNRAIMPNKLDLENSFEDNKTSANIAYALQPYTSIADSTIAVSDSELKTEYNKMKSFYKTPERRSIKYITVNIVPSEADYAQALGLEITVSILAKYFVDERSSHAGSHIFH